MTHGSAPGAMGLVNVVAQTGGPPPSVVPPPPPEQAAARARTEAAARRCIEGWRGVMRRTSREEKGERRKERLPGRVCLLSPFSFLPSPSRVLRHVRVQVPLVRRDRQAHRLV